MVLAVTGKALDAVHSKRLAVILPPCTSVTLAPSAWSDFDTCSPRRLKNVSVLDVPVAFQMLTTALSHGCVVVGVYPCAVQFRDPCNELFTLLVQRVGVLAFAW